MTDFQHKRSESKDKASAMPAIVRANEMFREVCGPRGWNDTRESWIARGARRVGITARRARAIVYQEPIRLTADEYISIQAAFDSTNLRLESAHAGVAAATGAARAAIAGEGQPADFTGAGAEGSRRPAYRT